jgi:hypothetical protein
LWALGFAAQIYIVCKLAVSRVFFRYAGISLFALALVLRDVWSYFVFRLFGFSSREYVYSYYYSDALLTVLMFLAIMHLYAEVFREMRVGRYIRGFTGTVLGATALFSYLVVQRNTDHLTSRFVVELSQNLYFVGLVLTYLLWGAIFKLRETRARLVQLVLALGLYFSATAALYAFRNMFPSSHTAILFLSQLTGALLPVAWAYTFTRVPEDARLVPGHLLEVASRH